MKNLLYLIPVVLFYSCAAPKYTASVQQKVAIPEAGSSSNSLSQIQGGETEITASIKATPSLTLAEAKKEIRKTYLSMSKTERKELRQLLKKEVKNVMHIQKKEMSVNSATSSGLDHDLRFALIFGVIGVVAFLVSSAGNAFNIIGAIALIIAAVFFIKWIIRQ